MASWNENEEGDNWVTYGTAFDDADTEEGRLRALQFGKRRAIPSAYEQRVLNEKGRPMRFHGAFTGGFSAGYFNSVGSKEGFKPQSFHSSRKDRIADKEASTVRRPEDFMDDEDFGEHGIAPKRIKMSLAFDDTHVRDSLKASLGGQSVIPGANALLKDLIIPSKGHLAERLLRRLGWANDQDVFSIGDLICPGEDVKESVPMHSDRESKQPVFAKIQFDAKTNTFGLGYSGLNPDIAMGRQVDSTGTLRHPEESSSALLARQNNLPMGFDPRTGARTRSGIRGQAFGVGAMEVEDSDVYEADSLNNYDFSIGGEEDSVVRSDDDDDDNEEAEMEAARSGRWSASSAGTIGGKSVDKDRKLDGWTAPAQYHGPNKTRNAPKDSNAFPGFTRAATTTQNQIQPISGTVARLPPGYMPVFHPKCIRDPNQVVEEVTDPPRMTPIRRSSHQSQLDAVSRGRMLSDVDSVHNLMDPVEELRLKAAAAGLPVPQKLPEPSQPPDKQVVTSKTPQGSDNFKSEALLKPFKTDPAKQARFEAFQVLIRRGFDADAAYTRCSGAIDMPGEEREREQNAFRALLNASKLSAPDNRTPDSTVSPSSNSLQTTDSDQQKPLCNRLAPYKQQRVAGLLSSRFRSAGCMDISQELSESEEKARRALVESLETVEPKDHAVATESYGAMTRRRLEWHPDRILCKRVNVPHPYPDSTFVGCPEEPRPQNPFRRRGIGRNKAAKGSETSGEFSLFDLLDVNLDKPQSDTEDVNDSSQTDVDAEEAIVESESDTMLKPPDYTASTTPSLTRTLAPRARGSALFACLFDAADNQTDDAPATHSTDPPETQTSPARPHILGPTLPAPTENFGIESDNHPKHPPMDLFKSIFASDEELSASDSEDNMDGVTSSTLPNTTVETTSHNSGSSFMANLFGPSTDVDVPLGILSHLTDNVKQPEEREKKESLLVAPECPNPEFIYGPSLPPAFATESPVSNRTTSLSSSIQLTMATSKNDRIQWTEDNQSIPSVSSHKHKRKHSSSKKRSKSSKKHKHSHRHRRTKREHKRSSARPPLSTSSSSSSCDE